MTVVGGVNDTICQRWTPETSLGTKHLKVPVALAVTVGREASGTDMRHSLPPRAQIVTGESVGVDDGVCRS